LIDIDLIDNFDSKIKNFSPLYSWKSAELVLNNNQSLTPITTFYIGDNVDNVVHLALSFNQQLRHIILIPSQPVFPLSPYCCVLSGEATNTNFIVFCLTRPGLEPTTYSTRVWNIIEDWVKQHYPNSFLVIVFSVRHCTAFYYHL
jgi:hypothetical protein